MSPRTGRAEALHARRSHIAFSILRTSFPVTASGLCVFVVVKPQIAMDHIPVRRSYLDLPSKIRNQIYQLSLVGTDPIRLKYSYFAAKNCGRLVPRDEAISTPLLRVCRKLQQEASSFVYAQNRFGFESLLDAQFFLTVIGPTNCRFLTRLGRIAITYSRSGWLPWSPGTRSEFALQPFMQKDDRRVERIRRLYQEGLSTAKVICELSKLPSV